MVQVSNAPSNINGYPIAIFAGADYSMMITDDGHLWGWGWYVNTPGSDGVFHLDPVHILDDVVYVATMNISMNTTFALRKDGSLWAWGYNNIGQIGDGSTRYRQTPVHIMDNIAAIATGEMHILALSDTGVLYAWGGNTHGQLGNGATTASQIPLQILENITKIAAGHSHSLAVTDTGDLLAWGSNRHHQLGNEIAENALLPTQIKSHVVTVAAGDGHSLAVASDNSLWAWGSNNSGQLGVGNNASVYTQVQVMGDVADAFADVNSSMAMSTDGVLFAWGCNMYSQHGNNTITNSYYPIIVMNDISNVSLREGRAMVVTNENNIYSWGKYKIGYYSPWGIHHGRQPVPVRVYNSSEFTLRTIYLYGRWRVRYSTIDENSITMPYFTIYTFLPNGEGMIQEAYHRPNETNLILDTRSFEWELLQNSELIIIYENYTYLHAPVSIALVQHSQGRYDVMTVEGGDFHKIFSLQTPIPNNRLAEITIR